MENEIDIANFENGFFDDFTKNTSKISNRKSKNKIPVVIISGFLGAGKTTLLNNILRNSPQLKIGAIVNDFGAINIDNKLVSGSFSENQIDLSNGCVCCMLGDNGLRAPLDKLANEDSQLDAIILEASGVAEPYDLLNTLRFSGNQFTYFGGNIYLIDAQNFQATKEQFPTYLKKCLQAADIFIINKIDLVSKKEVAKIREEIRELNKRALIFEQEKANIDPKLLFENNSHTFDLDTHQKNAHSEHDHHHHNHIHEKFQSIAFENSSPLSPDKFIDFLDNLPQNLFRMKGFCYFGMKGYEQKYVFQLVGKTIDIYAEEWKDDEEIKTELVLIGAGMVVAEVEKQLKNMIDKSPEKITPENMMNFERFLIK